MVLTHAGITLEKGERVEWHERMSYKANLGLLILGLVTIWFFLGLLFFILAFLRVKSTSYTDKSEGLR